MLGCAATYDRMVAPYSSRPPVEFFDAMLVAMTSSDPNSAVTRIRREPPAFRRVTVRRVTAMSPRLIRVTLAGEELAGFTVELPAASVRLLLPPPRESELVMPRWNGNEFLWPGGRRATIRTLTPRRVDAAALELDVEIVQHGHGVAAEWAATARSGDVAAISGPGRGYSIDHDAPAFLLGGDETAIPAMSELLEHLPIGARVQVHIEVAEPTARVALPRHPGASIAWCDQATGTPPGDALVAAVRTTDLAPGTRVWAAGEAAAMQRLRRHLFEDRGVPRAQATVRGYWKHGRAGDADNDA
jgi:NADPH-dependent ferric siderophore reductase